MKKIAVLMIFLFVNQSFVIAQENTICFENCLEYWKTENTKLQEEKDISKRMGQAFALNKALSQKLIGCTIPHLSFETNTGKLIQTSELKGKVVVLNFWFIGCAPCVAELPGLNKLVNEYQSQDVVFIALGIDDSKQIKNFLKKYPFEYYQVADAQKFANQFCVLGGYPTNMIFDKEGKLVFISSGGRVEKEFQFEKYDELKPTIEKCLAK